MDKVYKFSEFILDKNSITLYRQNIPVQLSSRAFEMLVYLIENRGKVVEKDDILDKVWKDSFVEEANLPVHISALRRVLQEKKGESRFIRTISGRGYSFIANVEELDSAQKIAKIETKVLTENKNASIAILPFTIEQSSEDIEYLANGITQSLIGDLSTIQDLRVLAYTAVKPYKNSELELQEIGFLLDADKLLIGVISEYKGKWEISVELINASDKSCMWATTETFEADDIFEVKKKISSAIVEKLKLKLITTSPEIKEINSEAQKLYYRGKYLLESRGTKKEPEEVLYAALKFFKEAIKIEPNFLMAYIGAGNTYVTLFNLSIVERDIAYIEAKKALQVALSINIDNSDVFVLKSSIELLFEFDFNNAQKSLSKAVQLNPNNADAYNWLTIVYRCFGIFNEALTFAEKACNLDQLSVRFNENLIRTLYLDSQFSKAISLADELLEFSKNSPIPFCYKALSYKELNFFDLSIKAINEAIEKRKTCEIILIKAYIFAFFGKENECNKILEDVSLHFPQNLIDNYDLAYIYLALGKKEKAITNLKIAFDKKSVNLIHLKIDNRFDKLRNEKEFIDILAKLNLK